MSQKDDDAVVTFIATRNKDSTEYSLMVKCHEGLTDQEFGDSLVAFAQDIEAGLITFDIDEVGASEAGLN